MDGTMSKTGESTRSWDPMKTVNPTYYSMATFIFHLYVSFIAMRDQVAFFK
jgi:hypothetical protein